MVTRKRPTFHWQCSSIVDDQLGGHHKGHKWDGWTSEQYFSSALLLSPIVQSGLNTDVSLSKTHWDFMNI